MARKVPDDADAFEPYADKMVRLSKHHRDIPPSKYLIPYCVRENEGADRYSCPHLGCDGLSFQTARECHAHEDRYHAGPYRCGTCGHEFAAQSALERHCGWSGHALWVCEARGCASEGVLFESAVEWEQHAAEDHGQHHEDDDDDDDSEDPDLGGVCREQACQRFEKRFGSRAEWDKHAGSFGHVQAGLLGAALAQEEGSSGAEFAGRMEAARALRCDKEDCRRYGLCMASSQAYYRHLRTEDHVDPKQKKKLTKDERKKEKKKTEKEEAACEEPECAKFGHLFRPANLAKHVAGAAHVRAVRMGEAMRQIALLPPGTPASPGAAALLTPGSIAERERSWEGAGGTPTRRPAARVVEMLTPTSPEPRGGWGPLVVTEREAWLEMRNRVLEEEVEALRRVIRGMGGGVSWT